MTRRRDPIVPDFKAAEPTPDPLTKGFRYEYRAKPCKCQTRAIVNSIDRELREAFGLSNKDNLSLDLGEMLHTGTVNIRIVE